MKASGKLIYGVQVGDVVHYDYTVTLPVIRHTVNALATTGEAFEDPDSAAARMYYRVAVIAEVFESLGTLEKGEITPELLLDGLTDDDMDIIDAELVGLKKKRMQPSGDSRASAAPLSSSDDSGSAPTELKA
ncbi:hypothetical protein TUM17576_00710 [Enterobacter hormaechei]|nr:hypothetical protein [Enterobacter hormaechei]GJL33251.1 hypothetical protein TUM17576_00710 [Enterobacter hormaechei]